MAIVAETTSEFVEAEAVAKPLRITARQVRQLAKEGGLPAIRVGSVYRFDPDAVGRTVAVDEEGASQVARAIRAAANARAEGAS